MFFVHSLVATYLVSSGRRYNKKILNINVYLFPAEKMSNTSYILTRARMIER